MIFTKSNLKFLERTEKEKEKEENFEIGEVIIKKIKNKIVVLMIDKYGRKVIPFILKD